jgi:hypothetical protein
MTPATVRRMKGLRRGDDSDVKPAPAIRTKIG